MVKNKLIIGMLLVVGMLVASCGSKKTADVNLETTVIAEGPFFEGGNSFMAPISINMKELLNDETFEEVTGVKVTGVEITLTDNEVDDVKIFNSASFQFVSDVSPMTTVAIMNPLEFQGNNANLVTSDEVEITTFFNESEFTALLDLDFTEYAEIESMSVNVKMNFKVEYK